MAVQFGPEWTGVRKLVAEALGAPRPAAEPASTIPTGYRLVYVAFGDGYRLPGIQRPDDGAVALSTLFRSPAALLMALGMLTTGCLPDEYPLAWGSAVGLVDDPRQAADEALHGLCYADDPEATESTLMCDLGRYRPEIGSLPSGRTSYALVRRSDGRGVAFGNLGALRIAAALLSAGMLDEAVFEWSLPSA